MIYQIRKDCYKVMKLYFTIKTQVLFTLTPLRILHISAFKVAGIFITKTFKYSFLSFKSNKTVIINRSDYHCKIASLKQIIENHHMPICVKFHYDQTSPLRSNYRKALL